MMMNAMQPTYYAPSYPPISTSQYTNPSVQRSLDVVAEQPNSYSLPIADDQSPVSDSIFTAKPAQAASNQNRYEMDMTTSKQIPQPQSLSNAQPKRVEPVYNYQDIDQGM